MGKSKLLLTGVAGFIGYSLANRLLKKGDYEIVGIDSINDYYDTTLKEARLTQLGIELSTHQPFYPSTKHLHFSFKRLTLEDRAGMEDLFANNQFEAVVHLAAQAGVRHSITHPHTYVQSNVVGFLNVLEGCRQSGVKHLVYASSSSVYGQDSLIPFKENQDTSHPVSLYAATKKSNELMAHTYTHLYGFPSTGLRFFTVYGPWGRPDMSPMLFADAIREGRPIKVFNQGNMRRDFTYIDDIVDGITKVVETRPAGHRIYNIGNSKPVELMDFISLLEQGMGKEAVKELLPMQPGDVYETYADTTSLTADTGYHPHTTLEEGIPKFLEWYQGYYGA